MTELESFERGSTSTPNNLDHVSNLLAASVISARSEEPPITFHSSSLLGNDPALMAAVLVAAVEGSFGCQHE